MKLINCPECGKVLDARFPKHLCVKRKSLPLPMTKIGPILSVEKGFVLNMQDAIETDCEMGSPALTEVRGIELMQKFPTIVVMAQLLEKERDRLKRKLKKLQTKTKKDK